MATSAGSLTDTTSRRLAVSLAIGLSAAACDGSTSGGSPGNNHVDAGSDGKSVGGAGASSGGAGKELCTAGCAGTSAAGGTGGTLGSGGALRDASVDALAATGRSIGGYGGSNAPVTDAGNLGYVCEKNRPTVDPGGKGLAGTSCCAGHGACAPTASVASGSRSPSFGHDTCKKTNGADDLVCTPVITRDAGGATDAGAALGVLQTCAIDIGGQRHEGRCIPPCFLAGTPLVSMLSSEGCDGDGSPPSLCAPCFDLINGTPTGACSQNGDMPKTKPPPPNEICGAFDGGARSGTCVPKALALKLPRPIYLVQDECSVGSVCMPTLKADDFNTCLEPCITGAIDPYAIGVCTPTYIVRDLFLEGLVLGRRMNCGLGELCMPCADPTNPGDPTHLCE